MNDTAAIYDPRRTALLVVDPYNDFLSSKGKTWILVKSTLVPSHAIEHIGSLLETARRVGMTVAYAPHERYRPGCHADRRFLHPVNIQQRSSKIFEDGAFGGRFLEALAPTPGDIVASEHSCSSGFAGTDLHEQLRAKAITHVIIVGMVTNSCIEATTRSAVDLDYHVTLVPDAVGAFSPQEHNEAVSERYPLLASAIASSLAVQRRMAEC